MRRFLEDYCVLKDLGKQYASLIYNLLYEKNLRNEIVLNSSNKRNIAKTIDVTLGSLNNMITTLTDEGVLVREKRGLYRLNDDIKFADVKFNNEVIMNISYKKNHRTINVRTKEEK